MSLAWYNENDPKIAAWLRQLITDGLVAPGVVDERSITDIKPHELTGYTQYHFFAGIGGWSFALRLAGWPDDQEVWTGSCPCQPLSRNGHHKAHADERHLWPAFYKLIAKHMPATVFGEQVASKDGREWLCGVRADMEGIGYAFGSANLRAGAVGAPHQRPRFFWVASNADMLERDWRGRVKQMRRVGDAQAPSADLYRARDLWATEPKPVALAYGIPGRVAQIGGFGNAIVPQLAAEFIKAFIETKTER